jgi:probable phosphoglycerate mutase
MTHLYLIRHGESLWQAGSGVGNSGLSPLGVRQAERLRDRLAASSEITPDVLIASTLLRARQTAEILAPAFGLSIEYDDNVQELNDGEAENMTMEEVEAKYGIPDYENDPFRPFAPGAEVWGQFVLRIATALDRITRQHEGKTIVIVCHGGVIDSSFTYFFDLPALRLPHTHYWTHNTSITYWRKDYPETRAPLWRLVRYNDDMHLRDLDAPVRIPWESLRISDQRKSQPLPAPSEE